MDWRDRAFDVGAFLLTSGILIVLFRPALDAFVVDIFKRKREEFKAVIEQMFSAELAERATTKAMTEENHDSLAFIMASVKAQGAEIPKISEAVGKMTDAVDRLTKAVSKIEDGNTHLALAAARVEERVAAWERQRQEDRQNYAGPPRRASDQI